MLLHLLGMGFMEMSLQRVKDIGGWAPRDMIMQEQRCSLDTVSDMVGRRNGGPSEPVLKSSNMQSCASKTPPAKLGFGDKFSTASPGSSKLPTSVTALGVANTHDLNSVANFVNLPFLKYQRSEELLLRWMELNAFTTVFWTHEEAVGNSLQ